MIENAFIIGVDHHLSSLDKRAALNDLNVTSLQKALQLKELYVLSTCNRYELYAVAPCAHSAKAAQSQLLQILNGQLGGDVSGAVYQKTGQDMLRHGFQVASSLESMVVGEPQILGQMKKAYQDAKVQGSIGSGLEKFLTTAFHVGKRVRHETCLAKEPVSVASNAVHLLNQKLSGKKNAFILVIGAGEMCSAAVKHLHGFGYQNVLILNRTIQKAWALAEELGYSAAPIADMLKWLPKAQAVVTCVAAQKPILNESHFQNCQSNLLVVDMAVPRNVAEAVGQLNNVELLDMDSLAQSVALSKEKRAAHVADAQRIIEEEVEAFDRWSSERQNAHMVKHLRASFEAVRQEVLGTGASAEVEAATRLLLNKILHQPTQMIKSGYVPPKGVEMVLGMMFGLRCPRVQFLQMDAASLQKGECPFVDVIRQEGLDQTATH